MFARETAASLPKHLSHAHSYLTGSRSDSDASSETEHKPRSTHHFKPTRDLRTALTEYYAYYNPEKLGNIDKIVGTFGRTPGGLRRMFNKLRDLYGVAPAYIDTRLDEQTPDVKRGSNVRVVASADRDDNAGPWVH